MAELQAYERTFEHNRVEPEAIRGIYIDYLLAECQKSDGTILVAEANGQVVAFVCVLCRVVSEEIVEKDRQHAYITDLVVLEPHRNTGIGSELIQAAESRAQGAERRESRLASWPRIRPRIDSTVNWGIPIARSFSKNGLDLPGAADCGIRAGRSTRRAGPPQTGRG